MYHPAWNGQPDTRAIRRYHALDQRGTGQAPLGDGGGLGGLEVLWSPKARLVGGLAMAFHGYRRSQSVGWALLWSLLGAASPPITTVIAVAQGYGKRKKGK